MGIYIPDIIVNIKIIIEIKSKPFITNEDKKQFCGYLKNYNYELDFLVNFIPEQLETKKSLIF
jgi:GxxExxY protein